jgi:branched-chain amino acid transport system permease protein
LDIFLQQLVNGLTLGSVYAIVALGYTMVYGIIQLINFAHGEVVMIGAMVALTVINALVAANTGLPALAIVVAGVLVAIPVCMAVGYALERVAYRPLRRAPRLAPLITAIGLSIILQHVALLVFSRNPLSFPQIVQVVSYHVTGNPDGAQITNVQIAIIGTSIAMMGLLLLLIYRTKLGIAMRATSQSQQVAGLMGIDIDRVIALTFVIGAALAAVAGVMVGTYYGIAQYQMGFLLGLKAFSAAVLGGVLLGVIEALGAGYVGDLTNLCQLSGWSTAIADRCATDPNLTLFGSNYQDVFAFFVLIAVLVFRPSGLLGERISDRA